MGLCSLIDKGTVYVRQVFKDMANKFKFCQIIPHSSCLINYNKLKTIAINSNNKTNKKLIKTNMDGISSKKF